MARGAPTDRLTQVALALLPWLNERCGKTHTNTPQSSRQQILQIADSAFYELRQPILIPPRSLAPTEPSGRCRRTRRLPWLGTTSSSETEARGRRRISFPARKGNGRRLSKKSSERERVVDERSVWPEPRARLELGQPSPHTIAQLCKTALE
ncbi:hypothetical protein MPTK1_2g03140 [Marchantia polymorpha subsp. ruderalis]|uniref:Uncharacterized protein n=1 Tax=Marchantia polymorpha TaxID=3197 RepID=A0A2R6WMA3_MARPO|nr:hypothetical protein MARPO_0075s0075 [Marchantia polymorpha]BBN00924.1 hypothetical protein Mp_2g03140 [Marchantia polymorpha subsp. ruderalis]|eukprot:PTQ34978.1 hypothetical protein MARPO_0075s0075 [Marchantia polymorpha]